jgi:hypothetical protein
MSFMGAKLGNDGRVLRFLHEVLDEGSVERSLFGETRKSSLHGRSNLGADASAGRDDKHFRV